MKKNTKIALAVISIPVVVGSITYYVSRLQEKKKLKVGEELFSQAKFYEEFSGMAGDYAFNMVTRDKDGNYMLRRVVRSTEEGPSVIVDHLMGKKESEIFLKHFAEIANNSIGAMNKNLDTDTYQEYNKVRMKSGKEIYIDSEPFL